MIREVIRPQYTNFTINIPTNYIDRDVEFIMFPLDEQELIPDIKQTNKKSLRGVFNQYADESKASFEDNAWQNHVMEKFKRND